jgi:hypothetical protein
MTLGHPHASCRRENDRKRKGCSMIRGGGAMAEGGGDHLQSPRVTALPHHRLGFGLTAAGSA